MTNKTIAEYPTQRITVNYDAPVEDFDKLIITFPSRKIGTRKVYSYTTPEHFKVSLGEGITSSNFPMKKRGIHDFQVTLFQKHPGVGYPGPGRELLEAIKREGYEPADIWQLVSYAQTYPEKSIDDIVATSGLPVALSFDREGTSWTGLSELTGLSLKILNFPKDLDYVNLALGIKE